MNTFAMLLFFIGVLVFIVAAIALIVVTANKKPRRKWLYAAGIGFVAMVLGIGISRFAYPDSDTASSSNNDATISSLRAANSRLKSENASLKGESAGNNTKNENSSSDGSDSKPYALNQKATLTDDGKNPSVSLTVTAATKNFNEHGQSLVGDEIESIAISNEKSVQFTISYTNISESESFLPSLDDFAVYDSKGVAATIVDQQEGQTEVSQGHTGSTTFWANFNDNTPVGSKVELEYQPYGMDSPITFDLTVN